MSAREAAGLFRRMAAVFYDLLLILGAAMILTLGLLTLSGGQAIGSGSLWYQSLLLALIVLFYGWFWTHGGQTPGMIAWRIQVQRDDGAPLRWRDAAVRLAATLPSAGLLGLGFFWSLFDRQGRAWHDRLSNTRLRRVRP